MKPSQNVVFLSHGGGPMPLLGDPDHQQMVDQLRALSDRLPRPSAILVVSAHWEEAVPAVTAGQQPELVYDYYGFPQESYEIRYPAPGEPALAQAIGEALRSAGIESKLDERRGFDHGVFVPLKLMYPDADIPVVQLSLAASLDPEEHLRIGEALRSLDTEGLLVIGSGFSFHNMRAFFSRDSEADRRNDLFQDWLEETLHGRDLDEGMRRERLLNWAEAPEARFCHPREEHLLPLHVCYGLTGRSADFAESATILRKRAELFGWATESG